MTKKGQTVSMRRILSAISLFMSFAVLALFPAPIRAQAALLMEEPYGFFGSVNPTGHNAIYFKRICAKTPTLAPENLWALTGAPHAGQNPDSAGAQAPGAAGRGSAETMATAAAVNSGQRESKVAHE